MPIGCLLQTAGRRPGENPVSRFSWLLSLLLLAVLAGGCATLRARPKPEPPPSDAGVASPLVVSEPRAEPNAASPPPVDDAPPDRPALTRAKSPVRTSGREPAPSASPRAAPLLLGPEAGVDPGEVEALLAGVAKRLSAIERSRLSLADQPNFDAAQQFLTQAKTASESGDLLYARSLGKKADALAYALSR